MFAIVLKILKKPSAVKRDLNLHNLKHDEVSLFIVLPEQSSHLSHESFLNQSGN